MIDAKEAVRLGGYAYCVEQTLHAADIAKEMRRNFGGSWYDNDLYMFTLQTIYNAGLVDGIQQERARRHKAQAKKEVQQ